MQSGIFMGTQWVNIANQNLWWIWKQIAINRQSVKQNLIPSNLTAWISFCLRSNGSNIFCLPFHSISFYIIEHLATPLCLYCSIFELYHHRMQFFHDFCRLCPFLCTFELSIRHIWKCIFFSSADNFNLPAILNVEEVDNKNVITTVWTWILPRKLEHTTHFHQ